MRYVWLLTVLLSVGVSAYAEEVYEGRPLDYWAAELKSAKDDEAGYAAARAVAAFGSMAAPYLPLIEPFLTVHRDSEGDGGASRVLVDLWPVSRPILRQWLVEATAHYRATPDHTRGLDDDADGGRPPPGGKGSTEPPCPICGRNYTLGRALEDLGSLAADLIPDLEALMRVGRWSVRSWGGSALLAMGEPGQRSLFRLLKDPDTGLRRDVLWHLNNEFYDRADLTKILAEGLFDPNAGVRSRMAGDLAYRDLKPVMPRIVAALRHRDPAIRETAVGALELAPPFAEGLRHLRRAFVDPVPSVRGEAAFALLAYAEKLPEARRALLRRRHDPLQAIRMCAELAVYRAGGKPGPAVAALVERIRQTKGYQREWAIDQLAEIGPPAVVALPQIIHLLRDDDSRYQVKEFIGKVGAAAVPVLLRRWVTAADSPEERDTLVSALVPYVNKNERVAQVLLHVVDDPSDLVVFRLFDCLGSRPIKPGLNVTQIISRGLHSDRLAAVGGALYAIRVAGALGDGDARRIIELLNSRDSETASAAVRACLAIPEHAVETVPLLVALALRNDGQWPSGPLEVLAELGKKRPEAAAALLELARSDNVAVRHRAVSRLAWSRETGYAAAALADPDPSVRRVAATALAQRGTVDEAVTAELIAALESEKGPCQPMYLRAFEKAKPLSAALKARLMALMAGDNRSVATWAAVAYAKAADDPSAAIPYLLHALQDLSGLGGDGFMELRGMGKPLRAYQEDLLGMLASRQAGPRLCAAFLLAKDCGEAKVAVPVLLREVEIGTPSCVYFAASSLQSLGPITKPYLPQLRRLQAKPLPVTCENPTPNESLKELIHAHESGDYSEMREAPFSLRSRF